MFRRSVVASGMVALCASLAPSAATAVPVSLKLNYTCNFPLLKPQPLELNISSDIPATIPLDTLTPRFQIAASANVSAEAAFGLKALEAASVEGTAIADSVLVFGDGSSQPVIVDTVVPKTTIPATGGFTTTATGSTPPLNFDAPDTVDIVVRDLVLTLLPRLADGTPSGLDEFESECTQVPGQNNRLAQIKVGNTAVNTPPTAPSNVQGTGGQTSVALTWGASTDNVGVAGYDVFQDGKKVTSVTGTSATIDGLTASTSYRFKVQARDAEGLLSPFSTEISVPTTGSGQIPYSYDLAGSAQLRTLTKGAVPLKGLINASLTTATGAFTADLALNPANARLTALGFLPVTAKIAFVTNGKTTGTLDDGILASKSLVRIKLPEVKLFGAIPLAGGNNCQTKQLSTINLKSGPNFDPIAGGTITGTFSISDLNGCGVLNGLVSPLTAGGGNAISLKLTPKNA